MAIGYIYALLSGTTARRALVVVPMQRLQLWCDEFGRWLNPAVCPPVYIIASRSPAKARWLVLGQWGSSGGVLILGYETFASLIAEGFASGALGHVVAASVLLTNPATVILDEGETLRSASTAVQMALERVVTARRIVLTGQPISLDLEGCWHMFDFAEPELLGRKADFMGHFSKPIGAGQSVDSLEHELKTSQRRALVLARLVGPLADRCTYAVLGDRFPRKTEMIVPVGLSRMQQFLYEGCIAAWRPTRGKSAFVVLSKIWNHPDLLRMELLEAIRKCAADPPACHRPGP